MVGQVALPLPSEDDYKKAPEYLALPQGKSTNTTAVEAPADWRIDPQTTWRYIHENTVGCSPSNVQAQVQPSHMRTGSTVVT